MAIEMNNMIVTGSFIQDIPKPGKGGRPHNVNLDRQPPVMNLFDEGTGKGMVAYIQLAIWSGNDQQEINAVTRQVSRQGERFMQFIELTFDAAGVGQSCSFRVTQGLPGPGQDARVVTGNFQR